MQQHYALNGRCPVCGVQCFDPFGWGNLIHNINTCGGIITDAKPDQLSYTESDKNELLTYNKSLELTGNASSLMRKPE